MAIILIQVSKESVRSQAQGHLSPHSLHVQQHIPPVLITSSPNSGSRIIRQSSQPEASNVICCQHACSHTTPSLRQLREPSEGIAGIAADSLRINGAMRPFRQVRFFYSSTSTFKNLCRCLPVSLSLIYLFICFYTFWQIPFFGLIIFYFVQTFGFTILILSCPNRQNTHTF